MLKNSLSNKCLNIHKALTLSKTFSFTYNLLIKKSKTVSPLIFPYMKK